jgi:ammonia channel protein AmtB
MLNRGFWERAIKEDATWDTIKLSVASLIGADFAAGAILISFGAMLGRVTASQLLVMATLEVMFYSINEMILVERFHVADIGGSMIIHTFGAYFGLACTFVLGKANPRSARTSTAAPTGSMLMEVVIDVAAGFYAIMDGFTSRHRDQETMGTGSPLRDEDEIILVAKDKPSDRHSCNGTSSRRSGANEGT